MVVTATGVDQVVKEPCKARKGREQSPGEHQHLRSRQTKRHLKETEKKQLRRGKITEAGERI